VLLQLVLGSQDLLRQLPAGLVLQEDALDRIPEDIPVFELLFR
jgi:hypothetical protein